MGFLEKVYLGNTLQNWLVALCIMVVAFSVLKIIHRVAISKLSKLAATTDTQIDDLLVGMLKQTKFLILLRSRPINKPEKGLGECPISKFT